MDARIFFSGKRCYCSNEALGGDLHDAHGRVAVDSGATLRRVNLEMNGNVFLTRPGLIWPGGAFVRVTCDTVMMHSSEQLRIASTVPGNGRTS